MPGYLEEIEDIPHADATDKQIEALLSRLKTFKEDEFAALLHQCHNVIRNREKKDPVAAFDETAKILFVKVFVERELKRRQRRKNLFTVEFLEEQIADNPLEDLFRRTKEHYQADRIFAEDERLNLKPATGIEIVRLLERYNLSDTSEDIKGIAFERFLGKTFRGEIGQFFTPRPIVEFMVRMVDPQEGEVICDLASGSGGFLIRFFEIVREKILADVDRQYQEFQEQLENGTRMAEGRRAEALRARYEELQKTLDKEVQGSRLWNLANRCIYGTDANAATATSTAQYRDALTRIRAARGRPISSLFELPTVKGNRKVKKIKTELLFIERCLDLLKPGGRLGIVLPEGVFNNPSLAYVREFCEDRAFIRAVISLPQETFISSGASVKASLLFMEKFTEEERADFNAKKIAATRETRDQYAHEIAGRMEEIEAAITQAKTDKDADRRKALQSELKQWQRDMEANISAEGRALLKSRFSYPIFLYEAEHVGITATGETDRVQNELVPGNYTPKGIEKTVLELYQGFRSDSENFLTAGPAV